MAKRNTTLKVKLTDARIEQHLKSADRKKSLWDTEIAGLYYSPEKNSFLYKATITLVTGEEKGKTKQVHRLVGKRSTTPIAKARDWVRDTFVAIKDDDDPKLSKAAAAGEAKRQALTLAQGLADMIAGATKKLAKSTVNEYRHLTHESSCFFDLRDTPLFSITPEHVAIRHGRAVSLSQADKDARTLRRVWRFNAAVHGVTQTHPVTVLGKNSDQSTAHLNASWHNLPRRSSYVQEEHIGPWFEALRKIQAGEFKSHKRKDSDLRRRAAYAAELMVWLGLRKNEILAMEWTWLNQDFTRLSVPAERVKTSTVHSRVLPGVATAILKEIKANEKRSKYVFYHRDTVTRPMEDIRTVSRCIQRETGFNYTPNDFRRTFATFGEQSGSGIQQLQRLMNHSRSQANTTLGYIGCSDSQLRKQNESAIAFINDLRINGGDSSDDLETNRAERDLLDEFLKLPLEARSQLLAAAQQGVGQ